ncbi:LuxR family transcriptional regulator [Mycobacterium sp. 852013-51886_SCH5428379]|uniref:helix-turn-helix transcriptional regulator n=1 Tax=Mycobacterium sp. 852013-51886_SCH5428379 TaxID=1834111 RepID=UPI0007FEE4D4|nr:LuxR family transcriptional regulator [Mycobacterium sp. 852013-51886_SCH5428379]OBB60080.1 LuxR family transcriptional regulator [Mycobacterium sp. 852013-51886_SCH5428379]
MEPEPNPSTEESAVAAFLAETALGSAGLIIEGENGIGKTRLWLAALDDARSRGYRVLSARAGQAETSLAYAVVADLLDDVDAAAALPAVQRLALDRILLRTEVAGPDTDHRVAAAAVLNTIERLCADTPVVVAIDDAQWLDAESREVIGFAARRLTGRVGILLTERAETRSYSTAWLQLPRGEHPRRHRVPPLTLGGLHAMLSERLGRSFPRPTLIRIAETSGGNPLYALELARAISEHTEAGEPTLPATLADVVRRHIEGLDDTVRDVLLAASCVAAPTVDLIASVTDRASDRVIELMEVAESEGIVEIDGYRIRFTPPLLARGVYSEAGPARRRHMHRRLADVIAHPELKARHLALAATRQDDDTLAALDAAAEAARTRGAPAAAAELLEFAMRLGGDTDLRRLQAAAHHFTAGDSERADALLTVTVPRMPSGPLRAFALIQLAAVALDDHGFEEAKERLAEALADSESDVDLQVFCLLMLSLAQGTSGDDGDSLASAEQAMVLAERSGQPQLIGQALTVRVMTRFLHGFGVDAEDLDRALDLEDADAEVPLGLRARWAAALLMSWTGRLDEARDIMRGIARYCLDRGADRDLLVIANHTAIAELWCGHLDKATRLADDAVQRAEQLGGDHLRVIAVGVRATVSAYTGDVEAARADVALALELAERCDSTPRMKWWAQAVLAFLEVSLGHHAEAAAALEPVLQVYARTPGTEIMTAWFVPDAVEAFVAIGRVADAEPLVARLEADGRRLDRTWMLAVGARCRALVLAATGDVDAAAAAASEAMAHHERLTMPFEKARTALVLGQLQRRQRRKEAAAATLGGALSTFEEIGARLWAQRVRTELVRVNVRPSRDQGLTPSEHRVAELAAGGMSNRDIAAALFISVKTVEANLGRVYRKLGVRGRASLGRHFG